MGEGTTTATPTNSELNLRYLVGRDKHRVTHSRNKMIVGENSAAGRVFSVCVTMCQTGREMDGD